MSVLRKREDYEKIEDAALAVYALRSQHSRGRRYPQGESVYRTAYQRDRDRIIHSAAFRRLEYKTQVFVNDEGDYFRTRLTHTLEVAQIGRTVARALGVNEDLVEAICLAHDLGHPPFGHSGEETLNALMKDHGGFNHNLQSYRVVTALERRYAEFPGLNLTHETLFGIAKHETHYDLSAAAGLDPALRASLEGQIANAADELAYSAHDLDDGLSAGLILPGMLKGLAIWERVVDGVVRPGVPLPEVSRHALIRELVGLLVNDLIESTARRVEALDPKSPEAIQRSSAPLVGHSEEMAVMAKGLKAFLYEHMYYSFRVVRMKKRAERFIESLFHTLMQDPRQLPPETRLEGITRSMARIVADYIGSMTDRSALLEYQRLFDPMTRP
ncbi:MAG: deoxyguanosinetriphosphate triphosphohydrolase [Anaerolineae bacterium]|nr:deoxyguanosinetriphosphate triphosphohydrolase [Anaerolineae bacterium]NUQ02778.1 deoxyguanosinetriphosphate triphosphohydrolase [Anaerolineae bacterium]